jgi:hypothetical protein
MVVRNSLVQHYLVMIVACVIGTDMAKAVPLTSHRKGEPGDAGTQDDQRPGRPQLRGLVGGGVVSTERDLFQSVRDRHNANIDRHDEDCEWDPDGFFLCHCSKRAREARGLTKPPDLFVQYPICGECNESVDSDGDGFTCPRCSTFWPYRFADGDRGEFTDEFGDDLAGQRDKHLAMQAEARRAEDNEAAS